MLVFPNEIPLKKMRDKDKWAQLVIGDKNATIKDVYAYYREQLRYRGTVEEDIASNLKRLQYRVSQRFG